MRGLSAECFIADAVRKAGRRKGSGDTICGIISAPEQHYALRLVRIRSFNNTRRKYNGYCLSLCNFHKIPG